MNLVDPHPVGQGSFTPSSHLAKRPVRQAHGGIRNDGLSSYRQELTPRYAVPSILAGTAVVENTLGHLSQAEGIVKLPVGEQPGIRGDLGTVEFKLQAAVKIDPKAPRFRFTHRVCHIHRSMHATTS